MAKSGNQLAKSLHTVSVLVNLGRHLMKEHGDLPAGAVYQAAEILGLSDKDDVYSLKRQAIKQLGGATMPEPAPMPAPRDEDELPDTHTYATMSD